MRRLSKERRQVAALAASLAAMSGSGAALANRHPVLYSVWLGLELLLLSVVIVKGLRLRRSAASDNCHVRLLTGGTDGSAGTV
jgi:hypothetical protein